VDLRLKLGFRPCWSVGLALADVGIVVGDLTGPDCRSGTVEGVDGVIFVHGSEATPARTPTSGSTTAVS